MATYQVKGPDGATYEVEGPDGATDQQIIDAVREQIASETSTPDVVEPPVVETPTEDKGFLETVGDIAVQGAVNTASTFGDIARGVGAGVINLPTGILQLGTIGIDGVFDTNTTRAVSDASNYIKDVAGLRPTGTAGQVAEGITTFASAFIPVVGWLGRASTVARGGSVLPSVGTGLTSKLGRSAVDFGNSAAGKALLGSRKRQAVTTTLAAGAADTFVAPDGTKTMSDTFDGLPELLQTESDSGLLGRDEAGRVFRNKLRVGAEGTVFAGAFEAAFPVIKGVTYGAGQVLGTTGEEAIRAVGYTGAVPRVLDNSVASVLNKGFDKLGETALRIPKVQQWFTTAGATPKDFAEDIISVEGIRDQLTDTAARNFLDFEKAVKKTVGGQGLFGRGKEGIQKAMNDLNLFLEGDLKALDSYDPSVAKAAGTMRGQIDGLTDLLATQLRSAKEAGEIDGKRAASILKEFEDNQLKYIRRIYELHLNPNKVIDPKILESRQFQKAVDEVASFYKKSQNAKIDKKVAGYVKGDAGKIKTDEQILETAKFFATKTLGLDFVETGLTPEAAASLAATSAKQGKDAVKGRVPLYKLSESLFKKRVKVLDEAPTLREIMGEIKDPKQRYLRTVGDMATSFASLGFYRSVANNPFYTQTLDDVVELSKMTGGGPRPLIVDAGERSGRELEKFAEQTGYKVLPLDAKSVFGGEFGSLSGKAVSPEIYNALTVVGKNKTILNEVLAASLVAKGLSQVSKTVLNPLAQIRNFNSGSFMIMANGNTPRNLELGEAMRLTLGKGANLEQAEFKQLYDLMGRAGIRDQNIMVNEFRQLLNEGSAVATGSKQAGAVQSFMDNTPILSGLQKIYAGTDTFWKVAGYFGEKGKFAAAFKKAGVDAGLRDDVGAVVQKELVSQKVAPRGVGLNIEGLDKVDFVDLMSTDIVKATMPTYSRVPESIKSIRRIPIFGNFIAFPAEIMRNTANITGQSLREMSFKVTDDLVNAMAGKIARDAGTEVTEEITKQAALKANRLAREIRAIGARRASGYLAASTVIPYGVAAAGMELADVSPEQMQALQKALPEFLRGHTIVPLSKPKDGKMEYIDFSYMNPYDFMSTPIRKALEIYSEKAELSDSDVSNVASGMWAGLKSIAEPFAGESLIAERVNDVLPSSWLGRGGRTALGSEIYGISDYEADPLSVWERSITHVMGGFNPGMIELFARERRGEIVGGRMTKALTGEPGTYGEQYYTQDEALSLVTGFRKMELDAGKTLGYRGSAYSKLRNDAVGNFSSFARRNDVTAEEIVEKYEDQNRILRTLQGRLKQQIDAAIALGISPQEAVNRLVREGQVSRREANRIRQNKFVPFRPSADLRRSINQETTVKEERRLAPRLPQEDINQKFRSFRNTPLDIPEEEDVDFSGTPISQYPQPPRPEAEQTSTANLAPVLQPQQVAATLAPPGVAQAGPTTAPSVGPASSTTTDPATLAAIIPNPRDQVLAARLRGTA